MCPGHMTANGEEGISVGCGIRSAEWLKARWDSMIFDMGKGKKVAGGKCSVETLAAMRMRTCQKRACRLPVGDTAGCQPALRPCGLLNYQELTRAKRWFLQSRLKVGKLQVWWNEVRGEIGANRTQSCLARWQGTKGTAGTKGASGDEWRRSTETPLW
jgi:hypothetical protein